MVQVAAIEVYLTLRFHCERQFGFVFPHNRGSDSTMTEFHNTMVVPFNVHPATQSNTTLHYTVCKTMQHYATLCNTMQHYATLCNTIQHYATLCTMQPNTMQHYASATHAVATLFKTLALLLLSSLQCRQCIIMLN